MCIICTRPHLQVQNSTSPIPRQLSHFNACKVGIKKLLYLLSLGNYKGFSLPLWVKGFVSTPVTFEDKRSYFHACVCFPFGQRSFYPFIIRSFQESFYILRSYLCSANMKVISVNIGFYPLVVFPNHRLVRVVKKRQSSAIFNCLRGINGILKV